MRLLIKLLVPVAVVVVAATGFLPPVFERGTLDTETVTAARAASTAVGGSSGGAAQGVAEVAAAKSLASHPNVKLVAVTVSSNGLATVVTVTTTEHVGSFLDNFPGLKSWFQITSTQTSQLGQ